MARLSVGIGHTAHIFVHIVYIGTRHRPRVWIATKQFWSDHVHTFVRTLCAKHHRHQQLIDAAKLKFCPYVADMFTEIVEHKDVTFTSSHLYKHEMRIYITRNGQRKPFALRYPFPRNIMYLRYMELTFSPCLHP